MKRRNQNRRTMRLRRKIRRNTPDLIIKKKMIFGLSSEEQKQLSRKVEPVQAFAKKPERIRTIVRAVAEHYFYDRPTHLMNGERLARRDSCRTVKRISFWLFGSSETYLLQKT